MTTIRRNVLMLCLFCAPLAWGSDQADDVPSPDQVIVEGTFTRRRQGGRLAVYNEVSAVVIRPLNEFDADLVG